MFEFEHLVFKSVRFYYRPQNPKHYKRGSCKNGIMFAINL